MAEEFNKILNSVKGRSSEEKINIVLETVKNVAEIVLRLHDTINMNFNVINQRINTLEFRINKIDEQLLRQKQPGPMPPLPPPLSPNRVKTNVSPIQARSTVMDELASLFNKKKKIDNMVKYNK
jgi:hypothetical protein